MAAYLFSLQKYTPKLIQRSTTRISIRNFTEFNIPVGIPLKFLDCRIEFVFLPNRNDLLEKFLEMMLQSIREDILENRNQDVITVVSPNYLNDIRRSSIFDTLINYGGFIPLEIHDELTVSFPCIFCTLDFKTSLLPFPTTFNFTTVQDISDFWYKQLKNRNKAPFAIMRQISRSPDFRKLFSTICKPYFILDKGIIELAGNQPL